MDMVEETKTITGGTGTNYCAVVPLSFEEKVALYMKCSKLDLARMLAERDRLHMDERPMIQPYIQPDPYYNGEWHVTCSDNVSNPE